jgi:hypothetical protein
MDTTKLAAVVGLLAALSVASERLVEIVKGLVPWLNTDKTEGTSPTDDNKRSEGRRRAALQILAVVAGCITAWLAWPAVSTALTQASIADGDKTLWILSLGLLASGGSAFWNSVLTYLLNVKNLKELAVKTEAAKQSQREITSETNDVIVKHTARNVGTMAAITLNSALPTEVTLVCNIGMNWSVGRQRNGAVTLSDSGSNASAPPKTVATFPAGSFASGDGLAWAADIVAPPGAASTNYQLDVSVSQGGAVLAHAASVTGTVTPAAPQTEQGSWSIA